MAIFHDFILYETDGPTDRQTDGRIHHLIEMRPHMYGFCYTSYSNLWSKFLAWSFVTTRLVRCLIDDLREKSCGLRSQRANIIFYRFILYERVVYGRLFAGLSLAERWREEEIWMASLQSRLNIQAGCVCAPRKVVSIRVLCCMSFTWQRVKEDLVRAAPFILEIWFPPSESAFK